MGSKPPDPEGRPFGLRVLVIDDEPNIRSTLSLCLEAEGAVVRAAAGAREAIALATRSPFDLAFLDLRLGTADGLDLLPTLLEASPGAAVVVVTAFATIESAVAAMRSGAYDYLPKPFRPAQIRALVARVAARRKLEERVADLEGRLSSVAPGLLVETRSPAMRSVLSTLVQAASSDASVLLGGESGTGKGVLARMLHEQSRRSAGRFVTVSCPTLSGELLASELFGHARGAFTGAVRDRPGRVEEADQGTLFLDEVAEIPSDLQAKLLRFLQEREFERVGETRTRHADVRIVSATHRDLEAGVREGSFRLDLLYRLNVIEVRVPSLRDRREDLPALARHFLAFFSRSLGKPPLELAPETEAALLAYPWPGNVRELQNEMERAAVLARTPVLLPDGLSPRIRGAAAPTPTLGGPFRLRDIEREHVLAVLATQPTREEAARVLGIDPSTLWRKLRRYEEGAAPGSDPLPGPGPSEGEDEGGEGEDPA